MNSYLDIISKFQLVGTVDTVSPFGGGLINDTYKVTTKESNLPDYILQRINHNVFQNVEVLQKNIIAVTSHIRKKLELKQTEDINRKVLHFYPTLDNKYYYFDGQNYWRVMRFIPNSQSFNTVNTQYSEAAGKAFGQFQSMLTDISVELEETIPNFHNMQYRLQELNQAVENDLRGRVQDIQSLLEELYNRSKTMCMAEELYKQGKLPKRICHCDTKVNNILFDKNGDILCVVDLDTVMPNFIFSDYGDFLRTGASTAPEDEKDLNKIEFRFDIFKAFTQGYLSAAKSFLTPLEVQNLPYAAKLFPYMQAVRFLTDYINGDTYYKIQYPEHNLVRTKSQFKLLQSIEAKEQEMKKFIAACL